MKKMKKFLAILATFSLGSTTPISLISFTSNQHPAAQTGIMGEESPPLQNENSRKGKPEEIAKNKFKGTEEQWQSWSREMIQKHILYWTPDAIYGEDYWVEYNDNIYRIRSAELIAPEQVDLIYYVVTDISQINTLNYMIDDDKASQVNIRNDVNKLINKYAHVSENIDYDLNINFVNGQVPKVGDFYVTATKDSLRIFGKFKLHFRKKLDLSNEQEFPTSGTVEEGKVVLENIEEEIASWYKDDVSNNFIKSTYNIKHNLDGHGSWSIAVKNQDSSDVIFNKFTFTVKTEETFPKTDISQLSETFDIDNNGTQWYIPARVLELIRRLSPRAVEDDFIIDPIRFINGLASQVGIFWVHANKDKSENPLTGKFAIKLTKKFDFSSMPAFGSVEDWKSVRDSIIIELKAWYPTVKENIDYFIDNNNYTFSSNPKVGFVNFPDFVFTIREVHKKADISSLNGKSYFNLDRITQREIEMEIDFQVGLVVEGIIKPRKWFDYTIERIMYSWYDTPNLAGTFKVQAVPESQLIFGSFTFQIYKFVEFNGIPTIGTRNQAIASLQEALLRIKQYKPNARNGVDYNLIESSNGSWTLRPVGLWTEIRFNQFSFYCF